MMAFGMLIAVLSKKEK
ncbi:hypothetical protein MOD30_10290 [Bacillus sonorensis]|nr:MULTISPECIES: hypothetical protein [unclassified Bacillus (in: firmicutes)]MCF7619996.1 hypothetical protein [Bacillus sonorensis]MCY7857109.1 hypothetical protein [Bacillus sonorensis]MCY8027335.1 hypothetical protein [Bacillus sonorensis]MCY8034564.1 hypothetical protein [Bacillus sonorensis]MCY8086559.1 hypothetical protein [Bacillus sonorensis]